MKRKFIQKEFWLLCVLILIGTMMKTFGPQDSLDARFYFSSHEARSFFQSLSSNEVTAYLRNELFDLGFIASYSFLFFFLAQRIYGMSSRLSFIAFMPGIFDLFETSAIIAVLVELVREPPVWLGIATCLKWTTGSLFILVTAIRWFQKQFPVDTPR